MGNIVDKYIGNILKKNKLSHAYLFSADSEDEISIYVKKFVKSLFCENNKDNEFFFCGKCKVCKQIEHNNYIDFYTLSVESSIKKDEISHLKEELNIKSSFGKKVYWIQNVDKMTPQAANSILKFLEEPEDNIIAILSTKNLNLVLNTIVSRCQLIKLSSKKVSENYAEIENKKNVEEYISTYKRNRNLATLNLIESIEKREDVENILDLFLVEIMKEDNDNSTKLTLLEILLGAKKELSTNVNYNLVIEAVLFNIIKEDIRIDEYFE